MQMLDAHNYKVFKSFSVCKKKKKNRKQRLITLTISVKKQVFFFHTVKMCKFFLSTFQENNCTLYFYICTLFFLLKILHCCKFHSHLAFYGKRHLEHY